ncbi:MAG: EAL domain-containing protein [Candidatus Competibacteraceae bacterium]|mgnify:CR=1 FL=1|nr:EAL domain-containing protein [Candidatus Competibacteraceae bacterium]HRY14761.1 EAL domain-containing protein [Candidatus Competibacteraceae bacterium]
MNSLLLSLILALLVVIVLLSAALWRTHYDYKKRKHTHELLRLAAVAFETAEAMLITDRNGAIQRVNPAFTRVTGYTADEVIGRNPKLLQSGRHSAEFYATLWNELLTKGHWTGEIWNRRKNGEIYPEWTSIAAMRDEKDNILYFVASFFDISRQKAAEAALHRLAYYDPLTQLPNRQLFLQHLGAAQASARRNHRFGAVLFVDLDDFRRISDARGHEIGDRLLQEIAARLTRFLRVEDIVAHFGGDRFAILLASLADAQETAVRFARGVAEKVRLALSMPLQQQNNTYVLGASVGVALFPNPGNPIDEPLKQAETALNQAKAAGRNAVRFFEAAMQTQVENRVALESEMRRAIERNELRLYLQPQVDGEGRIIGAEVLLRWQHPERGIVPPDHFIPLAEETGLIIAMGEWVLLEICRSLAQMTAAGHSLRLAVNISPRQFRQPHFATRVKAALAATGADPAWLTLEITEGLAIQDIKGTIAILSALKALGIHLSIDDFGTGYSSLAYLSQMPIDELKIDKSFLRGVPQDSHNTALVEAILAIAQHLHLSVVAEGVETIEQADFLRTRNCDCYQGYFYGRPEPAEAFFRSTLPMGRLPAIPSGSSG